jgi:hypothetical protein
MLIDVASRPFERATSVSVAARYLSRLSTVVEGVGRLMSHIYLDCCDRPTTCAKKKLCASACIVPFQFSCPRFPSSCPCSSSSCRRNCCCCSLSPRSRLAPNIRKRIQQQTPCDWIKSLKDHGLLPSVGNTKLQEIQDLVI